MAPIAASMARVHLILTPCSWALSEFSEIKTVHSLTPACSTFIRAIAAPERQVVEIPSVKPSAKQNNRVPGRLMRIRTLTSENPAEAPATSRERRELPVGSWEEGLTADTWQRHLLYPLSFYEQFIAHITRSSYAIYGQGMGPFFLELKVSLAALLTGIVDLVQVICSTALTAFTTRCTNKCTLCLPQAPA